MARNKTPQAPEELFDAPLAEDPNSDMNPNKVRPGDALSADGTKVPLVANVDPAKPAAEPVPEAPSAPVRRFRVLAPSKAMIGGYVTTLPAGKVLDSRHYDVDGLRTQGVIVSEMDAEE